MLAINIVLLFAAIVNTFFHVIERGYFIIPVIRIQDTAKKIKSTFRIKGESEKHRLVLRHNQGVPSYIQQFEAAYAKRNLSIEKAKVDIVTLKRRDEDLDTLFKRIYEDMVSGRLSAEGFNKPSAENETERKNAAILDLQELIDSGEQERHDLQQFLKNVRKYTDPQELTAEILNDLVDKNVAHAPDKSSGPENG